MSPVGDEPLSYGSPEVEMEGLEDLLHFVRDARGFDFTGYKRTSLSRRVQRRMQEVGANSIDDYRSLLEADVDEFAALFNTILINVTGFFRDPAAWSFLESEIIPSILARLEPDEPIRIWSAGCASGEEAYTLAMVMADALGLPVAAERMKIYGTDVDLDALTSARRGVYPERSLGDVPAHFRLRYFQRDLRGRGFAMVPLLRRTVVFGRHDLTRDPPISHVDLVSCRNTLMYLNSEAQSAVIPRLHYALRDGGYLFLGRAEMVVHSGADRFEPVSVRHRIFKALPHALVPESPIASRVPRQPANARPSERLVLDEMLVSDSQQNETFQFGAVASVLISPSAALTGMNSAAREILGASKADLGRPIRELDYFADVPGLTAAIEQVVKERSTVDLGMVHARRGRSTLELAVVVSPSTNHDDELQFVNVTLADVSGVLSLKESFHEMNAELETSYEELQSTNEELVTSNEELQSSYEELETTNEELQSANEELETTNEELRSSNEELEATNIELKSANDSIERMNAALVQTNEELTRFSTLHRHVMDHFPSAVVVLDSHLLIQEWNRASTDLWGLREDEVIGEPFFGLDFGLPLEPLQEPVRACRSPGAVGSTVEIMAINRLGRQITCRVAVIPTSGDDVLPSAMLIMNVIDA